MKNKSNEVSTHENGERWKLEEIPCPRNLEPRKQTFKICFEVEYELELTEAQKPHTHIVKEKENSKFTTTMDRVRWSNYSAQKTLCKMRG